MTDRVSRMRRLLCWIGFHKWVVYLDSTTYGPGLAYHKCSSCHKTHRFSDYR